MIIVSQNKEKAKKYNNIITISYDNDYETKEEFWIIFIDGEDMGHYKTRERAKEVLQEIVRKYSSYLELKGGPAVLQGQVDIQPNIFNIPKVYEMPEE